MAKKKVAFVASIDVPASLIDEVFQVIKEILSDSGYNLNRDAFAAHTALQDYIKKEITGVIEDYAFDVDPYDMIDSNGVHKFFKEELKDAEAERRRQEKEEQEEALARYTQEQEELKKNGRTLNIPAADAAKAQAILQAAGIKVKML